MLNYSFKKHITFLQLSITSILLQTKGKYEQNFFSISLLVATLFANPSTPYAYAVSSVFSVEESEGTSYYQTFEYFDWVPVEFNSTKYRHKNTLNYCIYIYLHYTITTPSTDGVYIWVRN